MGFVGWFMALASQCRTEAHVGIPGADARGCRRMPVDMGTRSRLVPDRNRLWRATRRRRDTALHAGEHWARER